MRRLVVAEPVFAHDCDGTHFEHRHCSHGRVCAVCSPRECWKNSTPVEEPPAPRSVPLPPGTTSRWGRKYFLSEKTIFKLRSMVGFDSLDDWMLGNFLDEEVHKVISKGGGKKFQYTTAPGESVEQSAVDVSARFGAPVIAIVGANIKVRPDSLDMAIITVVDHFNAVRQQPTKFTFGDAVADKFAGIREGILNAQKKDRYPDDPKGPMPAARGADKEIWVVRHGQAPAYKWSEVLADDVKTFITTLVNKDEKEIDTIKVYRPVKMQAKVEVKVDFGD